MEDYSSEKELRHRPAGFTLLACVLVTASHGIPVYVDAVASSLRFSLRDTLGWQNFQELVFLCLSVCLVAHDPAGYGIRIGRIRRYWKLALTIGSIPIILTALIYPLLPVRPFSGASISTWLIGPVAQDLFFAGYLYRHFDIHFPGHVGKRLPVNRCVFFTAFLFSLWHLPNFLGVTEGYVWFQLLYTFLGACLVGIIRQWLGSLLYILFIHMAVNWLAVSM